MKRVAIIVAGLSLIPAQAAAAAPARGSVVAVPAPADDPDGVGVTYSEEGNPRMAAARQRARRELPDFFARLANPQPGETTFVIKFDLGDGEFIWADQLSREDGRLTGRLINTPLNPAFSLHQRVTIADETIHDWGYFRGRVMQGNYSTRVQLDALDPAAAQQLRQALGW